MPETTANTWLMTKPHHELLLNGRRKTRRQERKGKNSIRQAAAPATASQKRAPKGKTTTETAPLTEHAFIHDVSPFIRCDSSAELMPLDFGHQ
jgi:hypothetical protein